MPGSKRVLCVVMDGIGLSPARFGNAVALARTPNLDRLMKSPLFTTLSAHGTAVGLPGDDDIGNSEVGHNALGAGRIFAQGAKLVNMAIAAKSVYQGQTWRELMKYVNDHHGTLHFLGLLSDGNVHAHQDHLHALMDQAAVEGVRRIRIHVLFDGRDVGEKSAEVYVERLEQKLAALRGQGVDALVASGGGRMHITMDRYNADWGMVRRGWNTHVHAQGRKFASLGDALREFRRDPKLTDQYLPEFVVATDDKPNGPVRDGDGVVFFNFRGDRAIEISRAFTESEFREFDRGRIPKVYFAGMMEYDGDLHIPPKYLVSPPAIDHTLTEYLLSHKVRQLACSETQKFGHVTYFWNGNRSGYIDPSLEEYVEIKSDTGITFDQKPAMKAREITAVAVDRMRRGTFGFGRINLANGDMVGHSGSLNATIEAVEVVDEQLGILLQAAEETGTTLIITADHGNADQMFEGKEKDFPDWDKPGGRQPSPRTAHSLAPVPFVVCGPGSEGLTLSAVAPRTLANVAATVVELLGLPADPLFLPSLVRRDAHHGR